MTARNINQLDDIQSEEPVEKEATMEPVLPEAVTMHYPEPALVSKVVADVATWSHKCFVLEPSLDTRIQIFAPHEMPPEKAYDLFMASLSIVNLRAVDVGEATKIVPTMVAVIA